MKKVHPFIYIFLPLWAVLAVWQACFTQLLPDEAYYWLYAQNLEWGYFDHPPMIALMIKAGTLIFANEWGVRCVVTAFSAGTLWLIYKIVQPSNEWLFIAIIISIVPLHLILNFAVPDVPLLFFTALFFYALKSYLYSEGKSFTGLLLIAIAGMLYSKYHAVLIIVFTLLAAPRVFRYPSFYFILLAAVVCYYPHILWQVHHNFRSVKYHLSERNESSFSIKNSIDYITGQLVLLGPISSAPLLYCAYKHKIQNAWQRVLLFNLTGFLLFFFVMSYRGHIEPNWTVTCWIPLIYLSYQYLQTKAGFWLWLKPVAIISLIGIVSIKFLLTAPWDDVGWSVYREFHMWRKWAAAIKSEANDKPVIFLNSYQKPSEYMFYAHRPAFSNNIPYGRGNQFDYWQYEDSMIGKKVMLVSPGWFTKTDNSIAIGHDSIPYKWVDEYWGFGKIKLEVLNKPIAMRVGQKYQIRVVTENFFNDKKIIEKLTSLSPDICYIFDKDATYMGPASTHVQFNATNMNDTIVLNITAPQLPGKYAFYLCFDNNSKIMLATNSERINVMLDN